MVGERDTALYAALAERLRANGLGRVVDDVLWLTRPAIRLDLTRVEDEADLPLGASKVGGAPDLPADTPWPTSDDGAPLPFIAQLHLANIALYDPEGDLPHAGLLSFFYAVNEPDEGGMRLGYDPSAWRVIWTQDDGAPLVRHSTPAKLVDVLDSCFPACSVSFARRLTLPGAETYEVKRIGFTNDERVGYVEVTGGGDVGYLPEMDHRLLGYRYELGSHTFAQAYKAEHGDEAPIPRNILEERDEAARALVRVQEVANRWAPPLGEFVNGRTRWRTLGGFLLEVNPGDMWTVLRHASSTRLPQSVIQAMEDRDRRVNNEWRLLLQIYSNEEAEMDWAGGGVIHFGIKRAALAARDFSQVCVSLQSV